MLPVTIYKVYIFEKEEKELAEKCCRVGREMLRMRSRVGREMPACELAGDPECCELEMTEKCWELAEKCCELIAREILLRADKRIKCCELTENCCARVDREMLQLAGLLRADRQGNAAS
jgi:hypothetical protein